MNSVNGRAGPPSRRQTVPIGSVFARRSTAQLRVEPRGLSREVVAFGEAGR